MLSNVNVDPPVNSQRNAIMADTKRFPTEYSRLSNVNCDCYPMIPINVENSSKSQLMECGIGELLSNGPDMMDRVIICRILLRLMIVDINYFLKKVVR
jgi:hypothetical protein